MPCSSFLYNAGADHNQLCYICNQRMGACIQCGNKNCYQAFHVTCARKAKLYLKMKSAHGGLAIQDASSLRALCDKHVPPEHRRQHDVDSAIVAAKDYYRREMRNRRWADSQQSALSIMPLQTMQPIESIEPKVEEEVPIKPAEAAQEKKRRLEAERKMWKLPSGAPIVPQVVVAAVDTALMRFTIRKRKEFVAEACKYWTLKREARRGASLLKRLQLQMETFSTMEITRRDFVAMGAAGGPRLQRRIEFAQMLEQEMLSVIELCKQIRQREALKLKDVNLLKDTINTVYYPISGMCWPILEKAQWLARAPPTDQVGTKAVPDVADAGKRQFTEGFKTVQSKLQQRWYSSVSAFSSDLGQAFRFVAGLENVADVLEAHHLLSDSRLKEENLTPEQRDIKKLAKRIARAVAQPLEEAMRHEAELVHGRPFERELKNLEMNLTSDSQLVDDASPVKVDGDTMEDVRYERDAVPSNGHVSPPLEDAEEKRSPGKASRRSPHKAQSIATTSPNAIVPGGPLTPPSSEKESATAQLPQGGIPWYLEGFEPNGLVINDERYDGEKVRREMSEPLSEMDEEELTEMAPVDLKPIEEALANDVMEETIMPATTRSTRRSSVRKRKRKRGVNF